MKKLLFVVLALVPLTVFGHASSEPHEEPPAASAPSQTKPAIGGFLVGMAVGMVVSKFFLSGKKDEQA